MNTIDVVPLDKRTPGLKSIELVLKMNLAELYAKRAARLNVLAPGHAEEAYLRFVARLVRAQASVLAEQPWTPPTARPARLAMPRTSAVTRSDLLADLYWFDALKRICRAVEHDAAPEVREIIRAIERSTPEQLADKAVSLLHERFGEVHPSEAVFIWTALSLQWAQVATFAGGPCHDEAAADPYHCRVCGASPCGSVVLGGDRGGLRYLHCSLCESRWHMVRARCSCCGGGEQVDYWSIDDKDAAIKIETCGECKGYLKILYSERDAAAELVADDLASFVLDFEAERMGYMRTGINPFAFPGGEAPSESP